jgi:DNA-binding MarR family transcriptional regulator
MPPPADMVKTMEQSARPEGPAPLHERARVLVLVQRYSVELTEAVERATGADTASNTEILLLTRLHTSGPATRKQLVELTQLSRSSLTQTLNGLETLGLIRNFPNPRDRRSVMSELTSAGRRRVRRMERSLDDYFASPNPTVKELLELLGATSIRTSVKPSSTLAAVDRLAAVGTDLSARTEAATGLADTRQRLALALAAEWGEVRPSQLADELGLTSGGITYLVDQLEAAGLTERLYETVPTDRRAVVIRLTAAGTKACERFADAVFALADEIIDVMQAAHHQQ